MRSSRIGAFDGEILGAGVGNYRRLFIDEGRGGLDARTVV
jgi:hypothetical protein